MATRAVPRGAVHHHVLSLVKSNSACLRHFLLHTSVPFHEIIPANIQQARRKMLPLNNDYLIVKPDDILEIQGKEELIVPVTYTGGKYHIEKVDTGRADARYVSVLVMENTGEGIFRLGTSGHQLSRIVYVIDSNEVDHLVVQCSVE
ncbi:hypothetical protein TNCV_3318241 [Trichonephila clavipes]|nr:hypothetical protein TNCV_3318241 [Trichonephila clavipes]